MFAQSYNLSYHSTDGRRDIDKAIVCFFLDFFFSFRLFCCWASFYYISIEIPKTTERDDQIAAEERWRATLHTGHSQPNCEQNVYFISYFRNIRLSLSETARHNRIYYLQFFSYYSLPMNRRLIFRPFITANYTERNLRI